MFDVGFSELLLLAIVALVVLGPEKLPHAARIAGAWVMRIRRTISTMQTEIEREVAAQEVRTALEKQFQAVGGQDFVKGVQAERAALEADLASAQQAVQADLAAVQQALQVPAPGSAEAVSAALAAGMAATPGATAAPATAPGGDPMAPPAPVLPEAAVSPDHVQLDGEAAYREWLDSQRRDNRIAAPAAKDPSA
jgi:sec-independent protein translocase protein TatB